MTPRTIIAILAHLRALRQRERWGQAQILAYQSRALARTRAYAYAHSPFYRRFHRGLEAAPLAALPGLTKTALMERFDELITDRAVRLADVEAYLRGYSNNQVALAKRRIIIRIEAR